LLEQLNLLLLLLMLLLLLGEILEQGRLLLGGRLWRWRGGQLAVGAGSQDQLLGGLLGRHYVDAQAVGQMVLGGLRLLLHLLHELRRLLAGQCDEVLQLLPTSSLLPGGREGQQ